MLDSLLKLWNKLEIRVLVISSLSIQILLLGLAGFRKYVISFRYAQTTAKTWRCPLALMFHWFLWFANLMADYVAIVALAYLPQSEDKASPQSKTHQLLMFWAPFFLLHLGGQDTITGLSIEDNDLWSQQLLTLLSQVALLIFSYSASNVQMGELWPPAALMFAVAIFQYGIRTKCFIKVATARTRFIGCHYMLPFTNWLKTFFALVTFVCYWFKRSNNLNRYPSAKEQSIAIN